MIELLDRRQVGADAVLAAQRSKVQMLLPSGSMSTPIVDPHLRPSGSFAQFSSMR